MQIPTVSKFDVLARFHETIPTVKSVSSSEIQRINFGFLTEITIFPFLRKLDFLESYNCYSSPTHPQSNGQAEVTIRTLKVELETKLEDLKGKWVEYLSEVLWAHITTHKSATQETPFALAFGTEAVAPVEVGLKSQRIEFARAEHNEEVLRLNLDLLEEKREQVLKRVEDYHRKTARYYDRRVRPKSYKPSDLVLKKLLPTRKEPHMGSWDPIGKGPISYPA